MAKNSNGKKEAEVIIKNNLRSDDKKKNITNNKNSDNKKVKNKQRIKNNEQKNKVNKKKDDSSKNKSTSVRKSTKEKNKQSIASKEKSLSKNNSASKKNAKSIEVKKVKPVDDTTSKKVLNASKKDLKTKKDVKNKQSANKKDLNNNKYDGLDLFIIILITAVITGLGTMFIVNYQYRKDNALYETELVSDDNISKFIKTYSEIDKNFYEVVDKEGMIDAALDGMLGYLEDNYSIYMNEEESGLLSDSLEGSYEGIGIVTQGNVIYEVYENSSAHKAGLLAGDEITKVNGQEITLENFQIISQLIVQNGDNENEVIVKRNGEVLTFKLKVGKVYVPTVSTELLEKNESKIGYMVLSSFSSQTYKQFKEELESLEDKNIESLIIDLRNNTGGYLTVAHDIASLFLEKNKLIYSLESKDKVTEYKDETDEKRDYQIVILVNSSTASAAEILTCALKDSYGATIVGKTTYGKGKVQSLMNYDNSMVKYTSAKWLRPNGDCIDEVGIEPDYDVSIEVKSNTIYDKQLDKAIELLS